MKQRQVLPKEKMKVLCVVTESLCFGKTLEYPIMCLTLLAQIKSKWFGFFLLFLKQRVGSAKVWRFRV